MDVERNFHWHVCFVQIFFNFKREKFFQKHPGGFPFTSSEQAVNWLPVYRLAARMLGSNLISFAMSGRPLKEPSGKNGRSGCCEGNPETLPGPLRQDSLVENLYCHPFYLRLEMCMVQEGCEQSNSSQISRLFSWHNPEIEVFWRQICWGSLPPKVLSFTVF